VNDGEDVMELLKSKSFDFIFLDIQMPKLNGYNTLQRIQSELQIDAPIFAITANNIGNEWKEYISYGFKGCLQKPFFKKDILGLIEKNATPSQKIPLKNNNSIDLPDLKTIKDITDGNEDKTIKIIELSINNIEEISNQLKTALESENLKSVHEYLHKLKSTIGLLGMNTVFEKMERMEKNKKISELKKEFETLEPHLISCVIYLKSLLK
jgi:CheY-like chemotaxis protein